MIKNIIFDFGDIFINLDKEIIFKEILKFGGSTKLSADIIALNHAYEVGAITSAKFFEGLATVYPKAKPEKIRSIWNSMLLDFPEYRLNFLQQLSLENKYKLYLLSNTNEFHINEVIRKMGMKRYNRFKNCFDQFYLSHEIHLRKPNAEIFEFVLNENKLEVLETFFIDDTKENTEEAQQLGIKCWHLQVGVEDIIELKSKLENV